MSGKKSSDKGKTSKGERNNVSPKIKALVRAAERDQPSLNTMLRKLRYREQILSKGPVSLREKIRKQEAVEYQAMQLFEQYKDIGVKWAACVQAVKTDWVSSFQVKWADRQAQAKAA